MSRSANLAIGTVLAMSLVGMSAAHATRPLLRHRVVGCVIGGKFVPYAGLPIGSHYRRPQKLPYWINKSGGRKAEGREIAVRWTAFSARLPNYAPPNSDPRWEDLGPCQGERLTTEPPDSE